MYFCSKGKLTRDNSGPGNLTCQVTTSFREPMRGINRDSQSWAEKSVNRKHLLTQKHTRSTGQTFKTTCLELEESCTGLYRMFHHIALIMYPICTSGQVVKQNAAIVHTQNLLFVHSNGLYSSLVGLCISSRNVPLNNNFVITSEY